MNQYALFRASRSAAQTLLLSLLFAMSLTLGAASAWAQVYVTDGCMFPSASVYVDTTGVAGGQSFEFVESYFPYDVIRDDVYALTLTGFGGCSPPPVLGEADTLSLSGTMEFIEYAFCELPCPDAAIASSAPTTGTMVVTFVQEQGSRRFFNATGNLIFSDGVGSLSADLEGGITIEDLGGGIFRVDSDCAASFQECTTDASGYECKASLQGPSVFRLTSRPTSDVPRARETRSLSLDPPIPNPARSQVQIRFALPSEGLVTLKVYDLVGRQVASLLDQGPTPAGVHQVTLDTRGWRAGCYFCRLASHSTSKTQMMVVLR